MKTKFLIIASLAVNILRAAPPVEDGKAIFSARCASCHNVNKIIVGPALANVHERRSMEWIINFVHSSQSQIKNGDKTAVELFNQFNHIQMPDHPDLTAENIKSVVDYIKAESKTAVVEKAPFAKPSKLQTLYQPLSIHDYGFFIGYLAVVAMLIVGLLFAVEVKSYERKIRSEKDACSNCLIIVVVVLNVSALVFQSTFL